MPDATVLEQNGLTTFPAEAPPVVWNPEKLAGAFTHVFASFKISATGEAKRYTAAVSELIEWAEKSDVTRLERDERIVAQFIRHHIKVLSDAVDVAKSTPLHEFRTIRLSEAQLAEYAQINQRLVQDYFYLNGPNATDQQRQNASDFFEFVMALPNRDTLKDILASQLRGAQAQAGLMRLLINKGWSVYVPDVNNRKEMQTWDVEGDVDLVVWKPGLRKLLLINSKGRAAMEDGTTRQQRHVAEVEHYTFQESEPRELLHYGIMYQVNKLLKSDGQTYPPKKFAWLRVTIPTSRDYLSPIGVITDSHIRQSILDQLSAMGK